MSELSWGLFLALAVSAMLVSMEAPIGPILLLVGLIGLILAYRYTYAAFYLSILLIPFLGFTLSFSTGLMAFGERAFGGAIDISVGEAVIMFVLAAWALKVVFLWVRRRDLNWKPRLPLVWPYAALVFAHLLSAFSPLDPDPVLVAKFAMRPVLFCYLAYVALPVNFIRSRRRLVAALSSVSAVGIFGALNGAISLLFVDASSQFIRRAHPLAIFGVSALGENHNLLAELMAVTVLSTAALSLLTREKRTQRLLLYATGLQFVIGLLTFSRTLWIVFALQAAFLAAVEYRAWLKERLSTIIAIVLLLLPLVGVMASIGVSDVATSSNSTRYALIEIATELFWTSPWIGSGAGTFVDRVGSAYVFLIEYGSPLDSHGVVQKIGAETGLVGLASFAAVIGQFGWLVYRGLRRLGDPVLRRVIMLLATGAGGVIVYQLFNTEYWTGKMWLPIGLTLAALNALGASEDRETSRRV